MKLNVFVVSLSPPRVASACAAARGRPCERPTRRRSPYRSVARTPSISPSPFEAGGIVRARSTAVIASRIMAPITEVLVRPGDRVRRGAPLVKLDAREIDAAAARAAAALAASRQAADAAAADVRAADAGLRSRASPATASPRSRRSDRPRSRNSTRRTRRSTPRRRS